MSLSYEPPVKITLSTAKDICDDIWACTIQYAKEAGFNANPLVTTTLWSGFLLTVKPELEKHGILERVQKEFVPSLAYIYSIGLDEVDLLADIKQKQQKFWEIISPDMSDLGSDLDIFLYIQLIDQVNAQFVQKSEGLPLIECAELFKKFRTLLASHVYNILRKVDNEMLLQFESAKSNISRSSAPQHLQNKPQQASPVTQGNRAAQSNTSETSLFGLAFLLILFAVLIFVAVFSMTGDTEAAPPPAVTQAQESRLQEKPKPSNGAILKGNGTSGESELTITASTTEDHVVSLKTTTGTLRLAFYVRAGQTATVNVPAEKLYVYFASGDKWYGYGKGLMFGEDTSYSKDDEILDFTQYTWEYTLYPVSHGNFSETPINESEFF